MITPTYPGVYVREESSGARAVAAAATSVAAFIGMAEQGRMDTPVRVFNLGDFENEFGTETTGELSTQVRQFFLNGGGQAWIVRIADGDQPAEVILNDQQGDPCLTVTARDPGLSGNMIRLEVDYNTASPERTFNLTVYRSNLRDDGTTERLDEETYTSVSMNPNAGNFIESVVNGASSLVVVSADLTNAPTGAGASYSGLVYRADNADLVADVVAAMGTGTSIRISVDNNPAIDAVIGIPADIGGIETGWEDAINNALASAGLGGSSVAVDALPEGIANPGGVEGGRLIRIASANGPVEISPAAANDTSVALAFGAASGGLEGDEYGAIRPAPSGAVARIGNASDDFAGLREFASVDPATLTNFSLTDDSGDGPHSSAVSVSLGGGRMYDDGTTRRLSHTHAGWDALVNAIENNSSGRWDCARHGYRLVMRPQYGGDNTGVGGSVSLTTTGYAIEAADQPFDTAPAVDAYNTNVYSVGEIGGAGGLGDYQGGSSPGLDGNVPLPADYDDAYEALEKDAAFNIMVLPRAEGQNDTARRALWGAASAFCAKVRAFLLVDPDSTWTDIAAAEAGVDSIRIGTETRNSATYWPRLRVADGSPSGRIVDPSGSIAGLMARTDSSRGVWKAPAGLEATIRGVSGVETPMTDPENGVINPKALNAIRVFPSGVVSWGARTLVGFNASGNIDDKYIPVRRTMLFIEESLYVGLKFAVFEPNDEPLWAQIRLAAGSFMNTLFRQGAFAGQSASDAYYVLCDKTTTTPTDINLGIVNVVVAFAPLKPAEFVILTVKQIAGQAQT